MASLVPAYTSREGEITTQVLLPVIIGNGGVGERLKPAVLKTVRLERVSGVRIPPPPPRSRQLLFSVLP